MRYQAHGWLVPQSGHPEWKYLLQIKWLNEPSGRGIFALTYSGPYQKGDEIDWSKAREWQIKKSPEIIRCLNLSYVGNFVDCKKDAWELKVLSPQNGSISKETWKIQTPSGVIGPFPLGFSNKL